MPSPRDLFDQLNTEYSAVHKTKEDLFWSTYMATSSDDAGFARAEEAYKNFISDPARLAGVRSALASSPIFMGFPKGLDSVVATGFLIL